MWQVAFFDKPKSPPTSAKHAHLEGVFSAWLRAPSRGLERVVFDGFAGAGSFAGSRSLGSPLLLLEWAARCPAPGPLRFVFVEKDPVNFARLRAALGTAGEPAGALSTRGDFAVETRTGTFEAAAAELSRAPAELFSFVDPYGCDDVRLDTVVALARRGEVVWHLATRALYSKLVSKNGEGPRQARRMSALLGDDVPWTTLRDEAARLGAARMRERIPELILESLRRRGVRARTLPLRGGASHLVCTTAGDPS